MDEQKFNLSCPVPNSKHSHILMAHGGGGRLMQELIEKTIVPNIDNALLQSRHDSSVFEIGSSKIAFTTDSFVVSPLFFPGGDIGKLAICGTVNDLAMAGARPKYLSLALIIEEGLPVEQLQKIMASIGTTASQCGVQIVTGDTKVIERGKGDGLYINTAGIGVIERQLRIDPYNIQPGDAVILSGDVGRHGIAIMAHRENLQFETKIESDCAPLHNEVLALIKAGIEIHCLRDLTRGGLASALVEIAQAAKREIEIEEADILVTQAVAAACEILGYDPLHVANEGRFVAFVPMAQVEQTMLILHSVSPEVIPQLIGRVGSDGSSQVTMTSKIGGKRIIEMLSGEQLPRIC